MINFPRKNTNLNQSQTEAILELYNSLAPNQRELLEDMESDSYECGRLHGWDDGHECGFWSGIESRGAV